jgi:hypothetical protein
MFNLTAAQRELFMNSRQVVRITFDSVADSTVLTEENIKSGGLAIDSYSMSGDTIEFGSVISSELQLTINNKNGEFNDVTFEGAECFVEVGTKDWSDESAQIVYIPMGYYTVEGSPRKLDTISFAALDRMVKFDRTADFTQITFPISTMALAQRIGVLCGVTVETTSLPSSMRDFSVTAAPEGDSITYRQLLSWIAQINGGCFVVGRDGKVYYRWYGVEQSQQGVSLPASVRYNSDIDENTITLSGIRIVYGDSVTLQGTDDYALTIEGNMLIQSVAQVEFVKQFIYANRIYNNASLTYYTPFTATIKSMPFVDLFDRVYYVKGETQIPTYITGFNFALNNSTVLEGNGKTTIEKSYAELNPMTTQQLVVLDKLHNKTVQEFKAADGELLSKIANATSKYDESGSPGTITLRGYDLPADAGYPAADHSGEYYLNETNGYVYLSNGTSWSKVAELDLITDEIESSIVQTASEIALSVAESSVNYSKNKLAPSKYTSEPETSSALTMTDSTGTVAFTATGTWAGYSWSGDSLGLIEGHTYVVTCTNNTANAVGRIAYRGGDNAIKQSVMLDSAGEKSFEFTFDDVDGYISVLATNNSTTSGSVSVTNLMVRDKTIEDSTFKPCADDAKYICSQISLTPEQIVLDSGRLLITAGNFQLDQNGTVTLTGGTIQTSNYAAASGSTKTVGGKINLNATGSTLMIDTANFKVTGGGAVTAEDATFTNCTIEGGSFEVDSTEQSGQVTNRITLSNSYLGDRKSVDISAEKIKLSRSFPGASGDISLDFTKGSEIRLASQSGPDYDRAVYSANKIKFDVDVSPHTANISYVDSNDTEQVALSLGRQGIVLGNNNTPLDLSTSQLTLGNLGGLIISPTLVIAGRSNSIFALYGSQITMTSPSITINEKPVATSPEIVARLEATVGHSCKNLLELSGTSGTTSGVNFTIDKISGTVTTANTSTGQIIKLIGEVTNNSDTAKNYWLSGGANNGTSNSYYLYAIDDSTGSRPKQWDGVTDSLSSYGLNNSVQIQIPVGHKIRVQILVRNGVNTDGLVFKPMLREASIADDTFEPYITPTDSRIAALEARVAALEART